MLGSRVSEATAGTSPEPEPSPHTASDCGRLTGKSKVIGVARIVSGWPTICPEPVGGTSAARA